APPGRLQACGEPPGGLVVGILREGTELAPPARPAEQDCLPDLDPTEPHPHRQGDRCGGVEHVGEVRQHRSTLRVPFYLLCVGGRGDSGAMALQRYTTVVDCTDRRAQGRWWAEVLDWTPVFETDEEAVLVPRHALEEGGP